MCLLPICREDCAALDDFFEAYGETRGGAAIDEVMVHAERQREHLAGLDPLTSPVVANHPRLAGNATDGQAQRVVGEWDAQAAPVPDIPTDVTTTVPDSRFRRPGSRRNAPHRKRLTGAGTRSHSGSHRTALAQGAGSA